MTVRTVCQQCGVSVSAGARFCANCGADVSAEQGNVPTRQFTSTQAMHDQLLDRVRHAALGEYEILTELGRGGMATVYLAHDINLDRKVAIKVMLPALLEGEDMIERFRLEARTAAQLSHPHIIPIYSVRTAEGLVYFVMKFVEGRPLDAILRELGQLPVPMVQSILGKVGEALGYAHRRGVVHRDIKPANLMIDVEGLPVVTDFGIAKVADTRGLTMTGAMMGTPTYMSPEQCSASEITGASDQYSLGVVAYQMLGGKVPFEGDTVVGLLYKHVHEPPTPLRNVRPDCPPALEAAVMRMLAKDPKDRFPTVDAAVEAIGSVSLAFDDPVRTQLIGLARQGENVSLLKRISTPMSPIPRRTKPMEPMPGPGLTPFLTPDEVPAKPAPAPPRSVAKVAAAALLVVALGVTAWLRPWQGEPSATSDDGPASAPITAEPPVSAVTGPEAAPAAVSSAADSTPLPQPEVAAAPPPVVRTPAPTQSRAATDTRPAAPAVEPPRAATVQLSAPPATMLVGASARLEASALDATGRAVARPISWRTADPRVATVVEGVVTAVGAGSTVITASADGRESDVTVRVTAPVVEAPAPVVTPPVSQAPPPRDEPVIPPREAIEGMIQRYARALETKQLSEVRDAYPGLTPEQETQFTQTLRTLDRLRVVLRVGAVNIVGTEATAAVTGEYEFYSPENRRTERLPVRFTATLDRGPTGWQIRSIR